MEFLSIGSSSKGNCSCIRYGNEAILIDAGAPFKTMEETMNKAGWHHLHIHALFLTHEHSDHIKGAWAFTKNIPCPVYGTRGTLIEVLKKQAVQEDTVLHEISQKPAALGSFQITPFHTPHDSADSLGYIIEAGNKKIGVCTDLGTTTPEVESNLAGCDFILLESNYDEAMLAIGRYPASLKRRISSKTGHLSNDQSARLVETLIQKGSSHFMLAHLSQENNLPDLARQTVQSHLTQKKMLCGREYTLSVAPVVNSGGNALEV